MDVKTKMLHFFRQQQQHISKSIFKDIQSHVELLRKVENKISVYNSGSPPVLRYHKHVFITHLVLPKNQIQSLTLVKNSIEFYNKLLADGFTRKNLRRHNGIYNVYYYWHDSGSYNY